MSYIYATSDLHIGDKSDRDNFKDLEELFLFVLEDLPTGRIVLVGDTFDIWAYGEEAIYKHYKDLIIKLAKKKAVFVAGNHDIRLLNPKSIIRKEIIKHGGKVCEYYIYKSILFLHGHQFDLYNSIFKEFGKLATQIAGFLGEIDPDIEDYLYNLHLNKNFTYGRYYEDNNESRKHAVHLVKNFLLYRGKIKYVVVGHTHIAEDSIVDGINYINCGSYTYCGDAIVGIDV